MISAYRDPDRTSVKNKMQTLIDAVSHGVPAALIEIRRLGSTLKRRAVDVMAFFDRPGTSNGPRRSTVVWNTSAAPPSATATSPITSPDHF